MGHADAVIPATAGGLREAVLRAIAFNRQRRQDAFDDTNSKHHSPTWWAAAKIKLLPEFINLDDEGAVYLLDEILGPSHSEGSALMFRLHGRYSHWEDDQLWGSDANSRDLCAEFMRAWSQIEFPGGGLFDWPAQQASKIEFWPLKPHTPGYRRLLSFAAHVQSLRGDEPIYLPGRAVSKALVAVLGKVRGVDRETIEAYISLAEREGLLKLVVPGTTHTARRFVFSLELFERSGNKCIQVKPGVDRPTKLNIPALAIPPGKPRQANAARADVVPTAVPASSAPCSTTERKLSRRHPGTFKEGMIKGLSMVNGVCRSIDESHDLDVEKIASVCDEDELNDWAEMAGECAKRLADFQQRLKKTTPGKPRQAEENPASAIPPKGSEGSEDQKARRPEGEEGSASTSEALRSFSSHLSSVTQNLTEEQKGEARTQARLPELAEQKALLLSRGLR